MRKFALAAVLALTSGVAYAGSAFEIPINGGVARVRIDDKCRESICASVSLPERGARGQRREVKLPGISAKALSNMLERRPSRPAAKSKQPAPSASVPASASSDEPQSVDRPAPASSPALAPTPTAPAEPSAPADAPKEEAAPSVTPALPALAVPDAKLAAVAPAPVSAPKAKASRNSPVGEWLAEDGEGQIRIEECGANLCGYVSTAKDPNEKDRTNPDPALRGRSVIGMPVLIDMKPRGDRWNGRIYNAKNGKTYAANIRLKNANTLRVEGCAFGGLLCGGQDWSRVN